MTQSHIQLLKIKYPQFFSPYSQRMTVSVKLILQVESQTGAVLTHGIITSAKDTTYIMYKASCDKSQNQSKEIR